MFGLDESVASGITAIVAVDALAFTWLYLYRRHSTKYGATGGTPLILLAVILILMCSAHFVGLNRIWTSADVQSGSPELAITMILATVLPGIPPAIVFAALLIERLSELGTGGFVQMRTSRRPQQDYSLAQSLAARGNIAGALAQYEQYYTDEPKNPKPLLEAYRLLYRIDRRDEGARYLRRIMKDFEKNTGVWAQAATELANYLQNDAGNPDGAQHVLKEIVRKAGPTEYGRLAQARLQDVGPRSI